MALVVEGFEVGTDPSIDANQTAEIYADRMYSVFVTKTPNGAS